MDFSRLKQSDVASIFQIHARTLSRWTETGCPRNGDGTYDLSAVIQWALHTAKKTAAEKKSQPSARPDQKTAALTRLRSAQAALAEMKKGQVEGRLVDIDRLELVAFQMGREIRDSLQGIPARISALLAAENDQHKVKLILDTEINRLLVDLSTRLKAWPADGPRERPSSEPSEAGQG